MSQPGIASVVMCLVIMATACAPGTQGPSQGQASAPTTPKILRMGAHSGEEADPARGGLAYTDDDPGWMVHSPLTVYDTATGALQPMVAERVPTVENGDWKVSPDGTMELTWKLRPNVLWHDGMPLTAEDYVFGLKLALDPELFARGSATLRRIDQLVAADAQTLVMRWKELYIYANEMQRQTMVALPRHLLGPLYETETKQSLAANPYWMAEFVGIGPYRIGQYQQGITLDVLAFDQYFLGRSKLDRIILRYFGDVNTLVVTAIAGDIDVIPKGSLKTEEAHVLNTQWPDGKVVSSPSRLRVGDWQYRDPGAPWVPDARVRLALAKLIDRQAMVDTIHNGLSSPIDVMLPKEDPAYPLAQQRGFPNFAYDPTEAHRLLAAAGWARGSDGVYRSAAGERVAFELLAQSDVRTNVQELLAIADQWKTGGIEAPAEFVSGTTDWREAASKVRGVYVGGANPDYGFFNGYVTSEITSQANRWRGSNRAGYSNPAFDDMAARVFKTINTSERNQLVADLVKLTMDQAIYLPLTSSPDVVAFRKSVSGPTGVLPAQRGSGWNIHAWDIKG